MINKLKSVITRAHQGFGLVPDWRKRGRAAGKISSFVARNQTYDSYRTHHSQSVFGKFVVLQSTIS